MPQVTTLIRTLAVSVILGFSAVGTAAVAQEFQQIELSDAVIKKFIAAQADLAKINSGSEEKSKEGDAKEVKEAPEGEEIDEKMQAELDAVATKHGFKNYAELDDVGANIALVLAGIDGESGEYTDPRKQLEKELAEVKADDKLAADEKADMVKEIEDAIAATPELQHKANIEIVKKNREAIEKSLE